jgi:hypothetical protein
LGIYGSDEREEVHHFLSINLKIGCKKHWQWGIPLKFIICYHSDLKVHHFSITFNCDTINYCGFGGKDKKRRIQKSVPKRIRTEQVYCKQSTFSVSKEAI